MRLYRLESKIVALFIILIVVVQVAGFVAIRTAIDRNARSAISDELVIGERVFTRLLDQNAQKLTQGARLLASDFGFRQAIGTDDRDTIASVLANHGARIGATIGMLVGTDGRIHASTLELADPELQRVSLELVRKAGNGNANGAADSAVVGDKLFQIVAVPVKAPVTIAWVVMGFPVGPALVNDMRALSQLQVSILVRQRDSGSWGSDVSTLPAAQTQMLASQAGHTEMGLAGATDLQIDGNQYRARILPLARASNGQEAVAVLQRSVSEAVAPYQRLQLILLSITVLGVLVAALASAVMARRITSPLRELAAVAKRLGEGDYSEGLYLRRQDEIGRLGAAFETMRSEIANRELKISRLAYQDQLTGLPNRVQFADLLKEAIAQVQRSGGGSCYILMMDLDRFQQVNDVLGHSFGDDLLRQVALRLSGQLLHPGAKVARLGGDEFAILLPGVDLDGALAQAAHILRVLEQPLSLQEQTVDLGAGIGVAGYPAHGQNSGELLSRAEVAMYTAKRKGSGVVIYDPAIDQSSQESLSLLSELRRALERDEFMLYLQPKLELGSGAVIGAEALVRWIHPEKGFVGPDNFIPFAETTGFIRMLTLWMMEKVAGLSAQLQVQGLSLKFSVNLSTRDLLDQELPAAFAAILERHRLTPEALCLEITESAIMDDPGRAQNTLERLSAMGFALSIDDFGTGYSSLAYLKSLPVDELKIDKSFVMKMAQDQDDAKIVRSTIDLGHNLGLRVVAEGVESEEVWFLLRQMGCDQGQGYFMGKPMPVEGFLEWRQQWRAPHRPALSGNLVG
ncbi:diguanylate phosphodiesterase [Herbaspirillum rubrisubalbicans]|uniref:Diguanylate phosphodiesterase n=2 Tax=Herbaspirillum rubrisubalbicans TaxID=80842 RepID=A0ABX9BZF5_9BURK|nr:EAL domain-containing protein [Herbaspirillum rubrisubalbicans]QJQ01651.1 GGDEF domain-containing protein [Herbaspirillum rubrisubalbicans Os34]RAM63419.1 diguanylate phosphodiesterase [Herbaspirillum rubrisubalbicans]RAN48351.1 diguanylate phosphodiesterase [Herbaspirillum rubrisubalbicans]